jgi:hypothetical protein
MEVRTPSERPPRAPFELLARPSSILPPSARLKTLRTSAARDVKLTSCVGLIADELFAAGVSAERASVGTGRDAIRVRAGPGGDKPTRPRGRGGGARETPVARRRRSRQPCFDAVQSTPGDEGGRSLRPIARRRLQGAERGLGHQEREARPDPLTPVGRCERELDPSIRARANRPASSPLRRLWLRPSLRVQSVHRGSRRG